jgi:hypothetical protein
MRKMFTIGILSVFIIILSASFVQISLAQETSLTSVPADSATHVQVGVWLVNVEKVDLPSNTYRLDFYLWFNFNSSQITLDEVRNFEFINGQPTKYEVEANQTTGYLEYRVKGDFITNFDFTKYPFESHELPVELEHKSLTLSSFVYDIDTESSAVEPTANVAGWNLGGFSTSIVEHSYGSETFSRFIFSVTLQRPMISAFVKSVLPVSVITAISLLAFFMAPTNFAQRITLAVTTLLAATTFHLSLLSGIPPTGYLTFADRIMISVYGIFLFNIAASVLIMRHVDSKKLDEAAGLKRKSLLLLPFVVAIMVVVQVLL